MAAKHPRLPEVRGFDFWGTGPAVNDLCTQDDLEVLLVASAIIPAATTTSARTSGQCGRMCPTGVATCSSGVVATASISGKPQSSPFLAR